MEILTKSGQTLADIAIQEYGCLEAVVRLSLDNDKSVSEVLHPGEKLQLHQHIYNKVLQKYCKVHDISPATLGEDMNKRRSGVFNHVFNLTFK